MSAILIAPRVPFVDPRTGLISREWYRFVQQWYEQFGGLEGVLPATSGGTGLDAVDQGDMLYGSAPNVYSRLGKSATASYLSNGGAGNNPAWTAKAALTRTNDTNVTLTLGGFPTVALLAAASLTLGWTGTLAATRGGTGLGTYAQGDVIYASAINTLAALAKNTNATRYLANTGLLNAPQWDQVNLTNGVTGELPYSNGGTGQNAYAAGDLIYASASNVLSKLSVGTAGQVLRSTGTLPAWSTATYPNTVTANQILHGTSTNVVGGSANLTFNGSTLALTGSQTISGNVQVPIWGPAANSTTAIKITKADKTTAVVTVDTTNNRFGINVTPARTFHASDPTTAGFRVTQSTVGSFFEFLEGGTTNTALNRETASGECSIDINPKTVAAVGNTLVRLFRLSNTSGAVALQLFKGDATTTLNTVLSGNGAAGYLNALGGGIGFRGVTAPTAAVHLAAGTTAASTAPLKFTSGTDMTAAEVGAMEFSGNRLKITEDGPTRRFIMQAAAATKTTAGAPYTNDGYVPVVIDGTTYNMMTTA